MVADGARIGANNGGGDGSEVVGEEGLGRGAAEPVHSVESCPLEVPWAVLARRALGGQVLNGTSCKTTLGFSAPPSAFTSGVQETWITHTPPLAPALPLSAGKVDNGYVYSCTV